MFPLLWDPYTVQILVEYVFLLHLYICTKFGNNGIGITTSMEFLKMKRKVFPILWDSQSTHIHLIFNVFQNFEIIEIRSIERQ